MWDVSRIIITNLSIAGSVSPPFSDAVFPTITRSERKKNRFVVFRQKACTSHNSDSVCTKMFLLGMIATSNTGFHASSTGSCTMSPSRPRTPRAVHNLHLPSMPHALPPVAPLQQLNIQHGTAMILIPRLRLLSLQHGNSQILEKLHTGILMDGGFSPFFQKTNFN